MNIPYIPLKYQARRALKSSVSDPVSDGTDPDQDLELKI